MGRANQEWHSRESTKNFWTSAEIHQQTAARDRSARICSTGKQPSWDRLTALSPEVLLLERTLPYRLPIQATKDQLHHTHLSPQHQWSPALTISKVLLSICSLLTDPN